MLIMHVVRCNVSNKVNILSKIGFSFFTLNPNISLKCKLFTRNIHNNMYIYDDNQNIDDMSQAVEIGINQRNAKYQHCICGHRSSHDNIFCYYKNFDTIIDKLIDQLSDLIFSDKINDNVPPFIVKKHFQTKVEFLHKKYQRTANKNQRHDDNKNIDTIISELFDQLPDSILDTINDDIDTYVEKKDFQCLAMFLRKEKVEYKRSNIKMYHDHGNQFIGDKRNAQICDMILATVITHLPQCTLFYSLWQSLFELHKG